MQTSLDVYLLAWPFFLFLVLFSQCGIQWQWRLGCSSGKRLIRSDTEISSFLPLCFALLCFALLGFFFIKKWFLSCCCAARLRALLSVRAKRKWVAIEEMSRKSILHDIQIWLYTIKRASVDHVCCSRAEIKAITAAGRQALSYGICS